MKDFEAFLVNNPKMSLVPSKNEEFIVKGTVSLDIQNDYYGNVKDDFLIKIIIPKAFPNEIPTVYEIEDKFPKTLDYHTFSDSSLCLGSPMSLKKRIKENPSLDGFINTCLVPYLYAVTLKLQGKESFVFGELSHSYIGIIEDYLEIFGLNDIGQVIDLLDILSHKPNIGNKKKCPCGCNRKVTKCSLHKKIIEYRNVMTRKEFAKEKETCSLFYDKLLELQMEQHMRKPIPYA